MSNKNLRNPRTATGALETAGLLAPVGNALRVLKNARQRNPVGVGQNLRSPIHRGIMGKSKPQQTNVKPNTQQVNPQQVNPQQVKPRQVKPQQVKPKKSIVNILRARVASAGPNTPNMTQLRTELKKDRMAIAPYQGTLPKKPQSKPQSGAQKKQGGNEESLKQRDPNHPANSSILWSSRTLASLKNIKTPYQSQKAIDFFIQVLDLWFYDKKINNEKYIKNKINLATDIYWLITKSNYKGIMNDYNPNAFYHIQNFLLDYDIDLEEIRARRV